MQLSFKNNYSSTLSVAVMWFDNSSRGCGGDGGNWGTKGWWNINPGDTVHTDVWTANRYFCFYAEAEDGTIWGGDYGPVSATYEAFQGCVGSGSSEDTLSLGMALVDAGSAYWLYINFTLNLD